MGQGKSKKGGICSSPDVNLPISIYHPKKRRIECVPIHTQAVFDFYITEKDEIIESSKTKNEEPKTKKVTKIHWSKELKFKELINTNTHTFNLSNNYYIERVWITGTTKELPFDIPFKFDISYHGRIKTDEPKYTARGTLNDSYFKDAICAVPASFENMEIIPNYGYVMEEFLSYTPDDKGEYFSIDTDSVFYDVFYQLHAELKEILREDYNIIMMADLDPFSRFEDTDIYRKIRMSKETYVTVRKYLCESIFNNIKRVNMETSTFGVTTSEFPANDPNIKAFYEKMKEKYRNDDHTSTDARNLKCIIPMTFNLYVQQEAPLTHDEELILSYERNPKRLVYPKLNDVFKQISNDDAEIELLVQKMKEQKMKETKQATKQNAVVVNTSYRDVIDPQHNVTYVTYTPQLGDRTLEETLKLANHGSRIPREEQQQKIVNEMKSGKPIVLTDIVELTNVLDQTKRRQSSDLTNETIQKE